MTPWLSHTLFVLSALVAVVCALMVVSRRNPIYSALYLILFFGTMSLDFILLDATFIAFMQLLVYAGAIMVLYLFVIMLINPREGDLPEEGGMADKGIAGAVALLLFIFLTAAISRSEKLDQFAAIPSLDPVPPLVVTAADGTQKTLEHGGVALFGRELFSQHLLTFELVSILITIGIVGAVHLSLRVRKRRGPGPTPPPEESAEPPSPSLAAREEEPAHV